MNELIAQNTRLFVNITVALIILLTTIFKFENHYFTIGMSISTSILAVSVLEVIENFLKKVEKTSKRSKFLTFFGCNKIKNLDKSVAIIIPGYTLGINNSQPITNIFNFKSIAERIVSGKKAAIQNDVVAAICFSSTFSKFGITLSKIKFDEYLVNNLDDDIKTYIFIGLSNRVAEIVDQNAQKYFSIEPILNNQRLSAIKIKCPDNIFTVSFDSRNGKLIDNIDYALFARFFIGEKAFIVCGAGTEEGTNLIGKYIMSDRGWYSVYSKSIATRGARITTSQPFLVIFKMTLNEFSIENITPVYESI